MTFDPYLAEWRLICDGDLEDKENPELSLAIAAIAATELETHL